jgi:hypothetical protein
MSDDSEADGSEDDLDVGELDMWSPADDETLADSHHLFEYLTAEASDLRRLSWLKERRWCGMGVLQPLPPEGTPSLARSCTLNM